MPKLISLPRRNSGHIAPRGDVCCNQTFRIESVGIGGATRAFCLKCGGEVTIVANKTITSAQDQCE
jgi:hypothetical protein